MLNLDMFTGFIQRFLRGLTIIAVSFFIFGIQSCDSKDEEPENPWNPASALYLVNYLGNSQNIHPKVLYFEEGWNGYKFWMAYTPYPDGFTDAENPCMAVSDDGIVWKVPSGLSNPLAFAPVRGYNSDTHLVYDQAGDRLECWWREFDETTSLDAICRRVSTDGVHWEEKEVILPYSKDFPCRLSPAVWIEDDEYKLVYSDCSKLFLITAKRGEEAQKWSSPVELPVDWGELRAWHQDVVTDARGDWQMVVCCFDPGGTNNTADLYYVEVKGDLSAATDPVMIVARGENEDDFDHRSIYRSSLVWVGDTVYLYYSAIDEDWKRHMALMTGPSVFSLSLFPVREEKGN